MITTKITADHLRSNIRLLKEAASESARLCAKDAEAMLAKHDAGVEFPAFRGNSDVLPQSYLESAAKWCETGASHEWGWARNRPHAWIPVVPS